MECLVCAYLDTVATCQHSPYGGEAPIDACVLGVHADVIMKLEGEIEGCGAFREDYALATWGEDENIVIVE